MMNRFQKAVAKTYGGGDYAYIADLPWEEACRAYQDCGDTLFTFLMRELEDDVERMDQETAVQRIEGAIGDLNLALATVNSLDGHMKAEN
jgi:hypothetical protein